ncbi:uncharacterized protein A4U43_C03F25800 [Asparagus officinalis]|uniref:Uncharacterized protein n=1 Tax=Asparagus officinalis TaxID=4686 RepID=A0A5P1FDX6_ASPOF|nr:uncharacterized protein A4U43_C03F25800 [Asparagus officinalis]
MAVVKVGWTWGADGEGWFGDRACETASGGDREQRSGLEEEAEGRAVVGSASTEWAVAGLALDSCGGSETTREDERAERLAANHNILLTSRSIKVRRGFPSSPRVPILELELEGSPQILQLLDSRPSPQDLGFPSVDLLELERSPPVPIFAAGSNPRARAFAASSHLRRASASIGFQAPIVLIMPIYVTDLQLQFDDIGDLFHCKIE